MEIKRPRRPPKSERVVRISEVNYNYISDIAKQLGVTRAVALNNIIDQVRDNETVH
jgi:predicted RNA-binding protein with RPS1 domain